MFYSSDEISPEASVEPEIEMAQFCWEIRKSDLLMNNIFSPANLSPLGEGLFSSEGGSVFGGRGRGGRHSRVQV